eukprot:2899176-Rhodomonas_salina.1
MRYLERGHSMRLAMRVTVEMSGNTDMLEKSRNCARARTRSTSVGRKTTGKESRKEQKRPAQNGLDPRQNIKTRQRATGLRRTCRKMLVKYSSESSNSGQIGPGPTP